MTTAEALADRRAIEALRAGVPNRDAVARLGCSHAAIEQRFRRLLSDVDASLASGLHPQGMVVSGDFGSGKSHLLEYLQHLALEQGFVCSKVVVSKETALQDPVKLFEAVVAEGRVPGRLGPAIPTLARMLKFNSPEYAAFYRWTDEAEAGLAQQFPATLTLFEYGGDPEYAQEITRFWAGDPINLAQLKSHLREVGKLTQYSLGRIPPKRLLAFQRFRFAARLARAAGFKGWVLLIDEAELIGRYTFKGRANAYAELARWVGGLEGGPDGAFPGFGVVAAFTADFEASVLKGGACDEEVIPNRLRASANDADHLLASHALRGIRLIIREREPLSPVTSAQIERTHDELRRLYSSAFNWEAPVLETCFAVRGTEVMRPHVRRWITQWDIARLYPGSVFQAEETPLPPAAYTEDLDLATGDGQGTSADIAADDRPGD